MGLNTRSTRVISPHSADAVIRRFRCGTRCEGAQLRRMSHEVSGGAVATVSSDPVAKLRRGVSTKSVRRLSHMGKSGRVSICGALSAGALGTKQTSAKAVEPSATASVVLHDTAGNDVTPRTLLTLSATPQRALPTSTARVDTLKWLLSLEAAPQGSPPPGSPPRGSPSKGSAMRSLGPPNSAASDTLVIGGRESEEADETQGIFFSFFFAHRTHVSHMSHPTFPTSRLLFLFSRSCSR